LKKPQNTTAHAQNPVGTAQGATGVVEDDHLVDNSNFHKGADSKVSMVSPIFVNSWSKESRK